MYIGFDQDVVTNYDQYYYYYSGEREAQYYTDENYGKEDYIYIDQRIAQSWANKNTRIVVFMVIIICSITCLMWLVVRWCQNAALDFRPTWVKEEEKAFEEENQD